MNECDTALVQLKDMCHDGVDFEKYPEYKKYLATSPEKKNTDAAYDSSDDEGAMIKMPALKLHKSSESDEILS